MRVPPGRMEREAAFRRGAFGVRDPEIGGPVPSPAELGGERRHRVQVAEEGWGDEDDVSHGGASDGPER